MATRSAVPPEVCSCTAGDVRLHASNGKCVACGGNANASELRDMSGCGWTCCGAEATAGLVYGRTTRSCCVVAGGADASVPRRACDCREQQLRVEMPWQGGCKFAAASGGQHDAVAGELWRAEVLLRGGCHGVAARLLHVCGGEQRCGREVAASVCRPEARCDGERRCGGEAAARVWWRDGCMGVAASGGSSRRATASRGATASGDAMVRRIQAGAVRR